MATTATRSGVPNGDLFAVGVPSYARRVPRGAGGLLACVLALLAGCPAATVDLSTALPQSDTRPTAYDDADWETVLRENVKDDLVDYERLKANDAPLLRYLALVSSIGPQTQLDSFKTRSQRLAYFVNVYNAAVLRAVLQAGIPATMHDPLQSNLETGYRLRVDGRAVTLGELRQLAESEAAGDVRVWFYLCDAARGSPPLRAQPLRADSLDQQLLDAARDAMNNPAMVRVDYEEEALLVSFVIASHRDEFLDYYRRQTGATGSMLSALSLLANTARREHFNTGIGYGERILPFDRGLNLWSPPSPATAPVVY